MSVYRQADPSTSKDAFRSVNVSHAEALVLEALHRFGESRGGTTEEIAEAAHLSLQTVTPRIKPLEAKGLVYRNGERRVGKSKRARLVIRLKSGPVQGALFADENSRIKS
ncbi:MarR family transcriptional regulator [Paraburkholderia sp. BR14320]|uniref:MarR family transcriptional regulator n=1 Tax=unclassified Paraburkholderia TaxID=2615204 RepID=UPI0034CE8668